MKRCRIIPVALAAICLLSGCRFLPPEETVPEIPVVQDTEKTVYQQVRVQRGDLVVKQEVSCQYVASQTQVLSFAISGERIAAVYVREGQTVKNGELLAELAHDDLTGQINAQEHRMQVLSLQREHLLENRELALAKQDALLAQTEREWTVLEEKRESLLAWQTQQKAYEEALAQWEADPNRETLPRPQPPEPCAVTETPEELDASQEALERSRRDQQAERTALENSYDQQLQSQDNSIYIQRLRLEELEKELDNRRIYAGMDGMVRYLQTKPVQTIGSDGSISYTDQVAPGQLSKKGVTFIILVDTESLAFQVSGEDAALFPVGTEVRIRLDDREIQAVSVMGAAAEVAYLQPVAPDPLLESGDRGKVDVILDQRSQVLVLPEKAVHKSVDGAFVYVLDAQGLRVMQPVTTGLAAEGYVEIVSGLSEGDGVVTE